MTKIHSIRIEWILFCIFLKILLDRKNRRAYIRKNRRAYFDNIIPLNSEENMTVKGKKEYSFYLTEENVEFVKSFIEKGKGKGGMSAFVDQYFEKMADTLRESGIQKGPMNAAKVFRIAFNGLMKAIK